MTETTNNDSQRNPNFNSKSEDIATLSEAEFKELVIKTSRENPNLKLHFTGGRSEQTKVCNSCWTILFFKNRNCPVFASDDLEDKSFKKPFQDCSNSVCPFWKFRPYQRDIT